MTRITSTFLAVVLVAAAALPALAAPSLIPDVINTILDNDDCCDCEGEGAASDTALGSTASGSTTPGPATPGLTTAGSTTAGSTTPGSTIPGPTTPGSITLGSTVGGSTTPGSTTSGSTIPGSAISISAIEYVGCYIDALNPRALSAYSFASDAMTVELCASTCSANGYPLSGVEYGAECYCDFAVVAPSARTAESECDYKCKGESSETCGGSARINIYQDTSVRVNTAAPTTKESNGFSYLGCYTDNTPDRTLTSWFSSLATVVTAETCTQACRKEGFVYAGLEFGHECFCGNVLASGGKQTTEDHCNQACRDDNTQICGGPDALTLYATMLQ